jgi:hypothetical protein
MACRSPARRSTAWKNLHAITGESELIVPGARGARPAPVSDAPLRRLGYKKDEMTSRGAASSILNECGL